jgi:hypothetical protein
MLCTLNSRMTATTQRKLDPASKAFLSFVSTAFNSISKVLSKYTISTVNLPPRKLSSFLRHIKNDMALDTPGVYSFPCKCGEVCSGQTGRLIDSSIKDHRHFCLYHPEKSPVVEHRRNLGHRVQLQNKIIPANRRDGRTRY